MKKLLCILMGLLPFGLYANEMKVPFSLEVDLSKKGTVYETDFQAPWNMWGTEVMFNLIICLSSKESIPSFIHNGQQYYEHTEEEKKLQGSLDFGAREGIPIPKEEQQYFKLKVTLTPLGWASNNVEIQTINYLKERVNESTNHYDWLFFKKDVWQKKEYKNDEKIEFVILIPLYGGESGMGGKTIMIADLQRLVNYHIKVESLEEVELPKDVKTSFAINRYSSKH